MEGSIRVDDLVNGRVDLICRAIANSVFVSHQIRKNTTCWILIHFGREETPISRTIEIRGGEVKHLRVDERNIALILRRTIWFQSKYEYSFFLFPVR
jgi:tRNA (pseudouridine54-N1)-methyltransferase